MIGARKKFGDTGYDEEVMLGMCTCTSCIGWRFVVFVLLMHPWRMILSNLMSVRRKVLQPTLSSIQTNSK
jgi:hypothetical protein